MIEINIPQWCNGFCRGKMKNKCCRCGQWGVVYNEGDGKNIHRLCDTCWKFIIKKNKKIET